MDSTPLIPLPFGFAPHAAAEALAQASEALA